jgi:hypothetical protein
LNPSIELDSLSWLSSSLHGSISLITCSVNRSLNYPTWIRDSDRLLAIFLNLFVGDGVASSCCFKFVEWMIIRSCWSGSVPADGLVTDSVKSFWIDMWRLELPVITFGLI